MHRKIRCYGESEFFYKTFRELNKTLIIQYNIKECLNVHRLGARATMIPGTLGLSSAPSQCNCDVRSQ